MRYEIRMHGYNENDKYTLYPPILETNSLDEAFFYMAEIKKHEEDEQYYKYEEVTLFDNGRWLVNMRLHR